MQFEGGGDPLGGGDEGGGGGGGGGLPIGLGAEGGDSPPPPQATKPEVRAEITMTLTAIRRISIPIQMPINLCATLTQIKQTTT